MKTHLSWFGEAVLWRAKRHVGALNKYDSELADGGFLGVTGMGIGMLIETKDGIIKTTEYRTAPEGRWNRQLVLDVATSFEQHVLPTADAEVVVIGALERLCQREPPLKLQNEFELLADLEWSGPTFSDSGTLVDVPGACICKVI